MVDTIIDRAIVMRPWIVLPMWCRCVVFAIILSIVHLICCALVMFVPKGMPSMVVTLLGGRIFIPFGSDPSVAVAAIAIHLSMLSLAPEALQNLSAML